MHRDPRPGDNRRRQPSPTGPSKGIFASWRRVPAEERAIDLLRAVSRGTVFTRLTVPEDHGDLGLSRAAQEAVIAGSRRQAPVLDGAGSAAAAMALTASERGQVNEWLERLIASRTSQ
jgi:hypothetical protein